MCCQKMSYEVRPIDAVALLNDFISQPDAIPSLIECPGKCKLPDPTSLAAEQVSIIGEAPRSKKRALDGSEAAEGNAVVLHAPKKRKRWTAKDKSQIVRAHCEGGQKQMQIVANSLGMSTAMASKVVSEFNHEGAESLFDHRDMSNMVHPKKISPELQDILVDIVHIECDYTLYELMAQLNKEILRKLLLDAEVYMPAEEKQLLGYLRPIADYEHCFSNHDDYQKLSATYTKNRISSVNTVRSAL
jgi:transposase-like protein